jgi:hypothetical protein
VADGTPLAAQKIERVLTNDPGMGVIRHVDAGYELAAEVAEQRGVRIPIRESGPASSGLRSERRRSESTREDDASLAQTPARADASAKSTES